MKLGLNGVNLQGVSCCAYSPDALTGSEGEGRDRQGPIRAIVGAGRSGSEGREEGEEGKGARPLCIGNQPGDRLQAR